MNRNRKLSRRRNLQSVQPVGAVELIALPTSETALLSVDNIPEDTLLLKTIKHALWGENDGRNEYVEYAYSLGGLYFVALLEAENGEWSIDRQSDYVKNGIREPSFGFCQIHKGYHPDIVNDPRFFTNWKWQIDTCYRKVQEGTRFYGADNIEITKKRFTLSI